VIAAAGPVCKCEKAERFLRGLFQVAVGIRAFVSGFPPLRHFPQAMPPFLSFLLLFSFFVEIQRAEGNDDPHLRQAVDIWGTLRETIALSSFAQ
jgi:hypothetical protein